MADAIKKFWNWWPTIRPRIEEAIGGAGFDEALVKEINDRVLAIRDGLDWELAPGTKSKHAFCLSAKGDPEGRLVTETWRARGPAPDETWEYHGARRSGPARQQMTLELEGITFKLEDFTVEMQLDPTRERVHGTYYHPAFARIDNERLRFTATYLTLDGVLGEDEVERWLGVIETSRQAPLKAVPMTELVAAVQKLRETATGEQFVVCKGEDDGQPAFAVVNLALKRVDHLLACMHGAIDIEILEPTGEGLPNETDDKHLAAMEKSLFEAIGSSAIYFGRETRRGRRLLHFFAPEDGPAASAVERWKKAYKGRDIDVTWERDPGWNVQRRFG